MYSCAFDSDFGSVAERNHYIGACALTCKYWAMKIRKALFRTLYVKSWSDVDRMLSLLSCSSTAFPSAASLMKHLIIIFDNSEAPWIHLPLKAISLNTEMKDVHIELHLQNYGPNLQQWAHSFDTIWYYQPHRFTWLTSTLR